MLTRRTLIPKYKSVRDNATSGIQYEKRGLGNFNTHKTVGAERNFE